MIKPLSDKNVEALNLFKYRTRLLTIIREQSLCDPDSYNTSSIFQHCCNILQQAFHYHSVLAVDIDSEQYQLRTLSSSPPSAVIETDVERSLQKLLTVPAQPEAYRWHETINLTFTGERPASTKLTTVLHSVFPVRYQRRPYGYILIKSLHCIEPDTLQHEFLTQIIDDIALAIYSHETALRLKSERDFNKEIVDTIRALMVTINPCGTILAFNKRAEEVTGFLEHETVGKYWVDVLISPHDRLKFQRLFSENLKEAEESIHFQAPLLAKDGVEHYINWHGSIRPNIETGKVGLVMLGIDQTHVLAADQKLNRLTARWEKIFIAIQDPALVVSNSNIILDANPATCATAKKRREDVIGRKVCQILHGGHANSSQCPLEQFIGYQKTRITETELHGLHGTYMLTVSPLIEENGEINATLLVARNLTEEEVVRAEAIRASQLAAIGELASGVAHEINNPINTIINSAQIVLDVPDDPHAPDTLRDIISEGKRIAGIVTNLLHFARQRKEYFDPVPIEKIISSSLQLVAHLLTKDGISCSINIDDSLPPVKCNEQHLQQVMLNLISNARYALNAQYPEPGPKKKFEISAEKHVREKRDFLQLTFTDYGTGIEPDIQERLFDPFFSTKPPGEGTGLGLSISHGLIRDHGGSIKVHSKPGEWTRFVIDLPT